MLTYLVLGDWLLPILMVSQGKREGEGKETNGTIVGPRISNHL